ncbi:uncharacterized protein J3R85_016955 [Psidium guajava]|nr:uncharacterized protein J3R85_016955 [Psidium guajava]
MLEVTGPSSKFALIGFCWVAPVFAPFQIWFSSLGSSLVAGACVLVVHLSFAFVGKVASLSPPLDWFIACYLPVEAALDSLAVLVCALFS